MSISIYYFCEKKRIYIYFERKANHKF